MPEKLQTRRTYWQHIKRVDQFFTPRANLALAELYRAIGGVGEADLRQKLLFLFTSILPNCSQMCRLKPSGIRSGVIYIPAIRRESNVFERFRLKAQAYARMLDQPAHGPQVRVSCQSAADPPRSAALAGVAISRVAVARAARPARITTLRRAGCTRGSA